MYTYTHIHTHTPTFTNLRLRHGNLQKPLHRRQAIQQPFIHIHIQHHRPILHLLLRNIHGLGVIPSKDQLLKQRTPRDIATLPHIQERKTFLTHDQVLQAREPHSLLPLRDGTGGLALGHLSDGGDVLGRRPATATNEVHHLFLDEDGVVIGHVVGGVVVPTHGVREACIGVDRDEALCDFRQALEERTHLLGTQGTVEPHTEGVGMADRDIKGFCRLP